MHTRKQTVTVSRRARSARGFDVREEVPDRGLDEEGTMVEPNKDPARQGKPARVAHAGPVPGRRGRFAAGPRRQVVWKT